MIFNKKDLDSKQRFSIRKLSVGVCSVLLSTLFLTFNDNQNVYADVKTDSASDSAVVESDSAQTKAVNADNKSASPKTASDAAIPVAEKPTNQKNTSQQTQESEVEDSANNEQSSKLDSADTAKQTQTIKTPVVNSSQNGQNSSEKTSKNLSTNSSSTDQEKNNGDKASQSTTTSPQASSKAAASNTQLTVSTDSQTTNAKLTDADQTIKTTNLSATKRNLTLTKSQIDPKTLTVSKAAANEENITPIPYTVDNMAYAVAGSTLSEADAAKYLQNAQALEAAGAKITWDGTPNTGTAESASAGETGSGKVKVTYADGTSTVVDVTFYLDYQANLNQLNLTNNGYNFYYVKNIGDKVDFNTPDANGNTVYNPNDWTHSLIGLTNSVAAGSVPSQDFSKNLTVTQIGTADTSTAGIHYAEFQISTNLDYDPGYIGEGIKPFGYDLGTYTISVPYIVQGFKLKDNLDKDSDGDLVIGAQLNDGNNQSGFDPSQNAQTLGQYFYQDFDKAYALGVTTSVSDWTAPTDLQNTTTNHFTLQLNGVAPLTQNVKVYYATNPTIDNLYFYNQGTGNVANTNYAANVAANRKFLQDYFTHNNRSNLGHITIDGKGVTSTNVQYATNQPINSFITGNMASGFATLNNLTTEFANTNSAGEPLIFTTASFWKTVNGTTAAAGSQDFIQKVNAYENELYSSRGEPGVISTLINSTPASYKGLKTTAYALFPTIANDPQTADVTNGQLSTDQIQELLGKAVKNPPVKGPGAKPSSSQLPNNNTTWPAGTTFTWLGTNNTPQDLVLNKAGMTVTGNVEVKLGGSETTTIVKDVTLVTRANVTAKSETVDYGTTLTAADLVTNKDVFPEGTTFQFANNTEPTWSKAGSYDQVQITATYPVTDAEGNVETDSDGKPVTVTTDPTTVAVAINDSRLINVVEGSDTPNIDQVLNLPSDWTEHTVTWTTPINTNTDNEGLITIHYPSSNLDQEIKVYVSIIPKLSPKDGLEFNTNGTSYNGKDGSIANGDNQGKNLTNATGDTISYTQYVNEGQAGQPSDITQETTSYTPTYSVSGLKTNTDGSLVSGNQSATIRVSVPKGTFGATTDADGNSYYELQSNIVVAQPVTFEFVDDDENKKVVGTPQTQEFIKDQATTISPALVIPENYELAKNQTLPTSYTLSDYSTTNPVVQIHLVHKTEDISDTDPNTKETRTLTVQFVNAKTGESMGDLAPDAKLNVFYKRTAIKDLVTNKVTYGNWQWDTSQGDKGYQVVSGTWTTPSSWAAVSATVPTVDGYTAFTTGDWEKNADGSISSAPANDFVFPTYTGKDTSVAGEESVAYTDKSPVYEGLATHTVYFAPIQYEYRTVTEHFKKYDNGNYVDADVVDMPDGSKQSYAQAQVWYQKAATAFATNGKSDAKDWTITYGGWSWNKDAGDKDTPGITILSGGYVSIDGKKVGQGLWGIPTTGSWAITVPSLAGYTVANLREDAVNTSYGFGNPNGNPDNGFTNATDGTWYWRNSLTTIYVPNSDLNKTITRTINVQDPITGQMKTVTTQTVTFNRAVRLNKGTNTPGDYGDDKIVFGALIDNNAYNFVAGDNVWNHTSSEDVAHQTFPQYATNIVQAGYTAYINGQAVTSVPAETITPDSENLVVNVTYHAIATAQLSGNGSATYTGSPITIDQLNNGSTGLKINVTGPTANRGSLPLSAGDVEFSTDGTTWTTTLPTNAGTYQVRLTDQGIAAIKKQYGNGDIILWTDENGASTITSNATFTINPASSNAVLANTEAGNYTKVYDATPTSTIDASKFSLTTTLNGQTVNLDTTGITDSSYEWVDANGDPISNPENVGTYYIKLTDDAFATLEKNNPNFQLTNTGRGVYTITQADATGVLSGSNSSTYTGNPISTAQVNSNGQIVVTVNFPGVTDANKTYTLKDGDYTWNTGSAPTNVGDYTITLTATGINNIENYIVSLAGKGQNDTPNVKFADSAITGSASYEITRANATATIGGNFERTYDGQAVDGTSVYGAIDWSAHDTSNNVDFNLQHEISANDYSWYTKNGDQYVKFNGRPVNAGTYYLILNQDYVDKLDQENPNYHFTSVNGAFTYTINKAQATVNLSGNQSNLYTGKAVEINYNNFPVSITTNNGLTIDVPAGVQLSRDDIEITDASGNSVADPTQIGTYTLKLTESGLQKFESQTDNYNWNSAGSGILSITRNTNVSVKLSGNEDIVYSGTTAEITPSNFHVTLGNGATYQLVDGDLEYVDQTTGANTNVGTYEVKLSQQGIDNISKVDSENYGYNFNDVGVGTVTITKATPSASIAGNAEKNYDGTPISDYVPTVTISAPGTNSVTLTTGDFEWVKDGQVYTSAPSDAGTYTVQLTQAGIDKIKAVNSQNLNWDGVQITGNGTYIINRANAIIELPDTTSQTSSWTGQAVVIDPSNFVPVITTDNPNQKEIAFPADLKLSSIDYEFLKDGQVIAAPSEIGTYQVALTASGWQKVRDAISGNSNYNWTYQGQGSYNITKATATITLNGSSSTIYTGSAVVIPSENGVVKGISVTLSNGQTYALKPEDLEFVDNDGNQISTPSLPGQYKVKLTSTALGQIRGLDSEHYDYTYDNSTADFEIKKANARVGIIGSQESTYDGGVISLEPGNYSVIIVTNNGQSLEYTLQAGDLTTTVADPTNAGNYDVLLSEQGKEHIRALNANYNWNFIESPALLHIAPAQMTVSVVGTASSIYNGQPVKFTSQDQLKDLKLRWGGYDKAPDGIEFTLTPEDLVINGGADAIERGQYPITLSQSAINRLNAENPNYDFSQADTNLAHYIIFARKARITLSGTQTTPYGIHAALDPSNFTISLTDTADGTPILYPTTLTSGDLEFKDTQYSETNLPTQVGHYELVPSQKLLKALEEYYPNYDFGNGTEEQNSNVVINGNNSDPNAISDPSSDVDPEHTRGANYVITAVDAYISLEGSQTVRYTGKDQTIDYSNYHVSLAGLTNGDNYTYTLQDGDLDFVNGTPNDVGNYKVQLSAQGLEHIRALNNVDYNWLVADDAATAPFTVTQMPVTITVSDKDAVPTIIYGESTSLNPGNYNITVETADHQILNYAPVAGDLQFKNGTPTSVGTFEVVLSNQGLQNIEKQFGTKNYTYTSTGEGTFIINKAEANIKIAANGSDSKIYDGKAASLNAQDYKLEITTNNGQTIVIPLAAGDLVFSDGTNPVDAGSYQVTLSQTALDKIKQEYSNYNWSTPVAGTYTIEKATANVTTAGSYEVTYNGQTPAIDLAKITNTIATNNNITLTAPSLSSDDFEWVDKDGNSITAPVNVGTYYLKLKQSGQEKIATNNNYNWNFDGLATVVINQANATISFNGTQSVPYTGSVITPSTDNFKVTLPNGMTYSLTAKDIQVDGNPVDVGTYQVELTQAGIDAISAKYPNYNFNYDGSRGLLTITQANATATVSGSQTTKVPSLDPENYTATIQLNGQDKVITGLTSDNFVFSQDGHPAQLTEAGTYDVELSGDAINKLRQENPNYNISFTSTATFTLENSSQTINYVDSDNNVISSEVLDGHIQGTKVPFIPQIPVGWTLSDPASVPSEITLANGTTSIAIKHGTKDVSHTDPVPDGGKTPTDKVIDGAHEKDLNQTITRTIIVTMPDGTKTTTAQTAHIYRDASYDEVTGEVTYGKWSTAKWDAFTPVTVAGYTASESNVPAVEVKDGQKDVTVNITYVPNAQATNIVYKDSAGNVIKTDKVSGKTDETVKVDSTVPAGWKLVNGQTVPATITFGPDGYPNIVVQIEHGIKDVSHTDPVPDGAKTPTDKVIDGAHEKDLNQTITRTINVTTPDGKKTTTTQVAHIYRDASYDEVTGEVTYGEWSTAKWDAFTPAVIAGYTPTVSKVNEIKVENGQKDVTVEISYTANAQSTNIIYQDKSGKTIKIDSVTGKTDQTIDIDSTVPAGWKLVNGQTIPATITFGPDGYPDIVVQIEHGTKDVSHTDPVPDGAKTPTDKVIDGAHEKDLNQTITRTINVIAPDGKKTTTTQVAHIYRDASYDEVTGEVTYGEWSTAKWDEFTPAVVAGYTPTKATVPAVEVKSGQKDVTVNITYEPNAQTTNIVYRDLEGSVVRTDKVAGKTDEKVNISLAIPDGWKLVSGQNIPTTITFGPDGHPDIVVQIEHGTKDVSHTDPVPDGAKTPTDKVIDGAHEKDLNQTITRTINVTTPDGNTTTTTQVAHIYRDASYDEVTGEVTYGEWSTAKWDEFTPATIAGYTPTERDVPAVEVKDGQKNVTVDISYQANSQRTSIVYKDSEGQIIKSDTINGKTNETVKVDSTVPAGWKLINGQIIPATITFDSNGHPDIVVQIEHGTITVTPDTPSQDIPSGQKVPGNPDRIYPEMERLISEPTRTIVVTRPNGTKEIITQKVKFTRNAIFDQVSGAVSYSEWKTTSSSIWAAYVPEAISGYTPTMVQVDQEVVNADTQNVTINISYIKNVVPPTKETQTIEYQDENGKTIATETITGEKGEEIPFTPHLPENWQAADDLPKIIPIGENGATTIIRVVPKMETTNVSKTITRTIIEHLPNGDKRVVQTVTLTGIQTKNMVTGEVQTKWNTGKFDAYIPETVTDYTAVPNIVLEETVDAATANSTVEINYVKNKVQPNNEQPSSKDPKPENKKTQPTYKAENFAKGSRQAGKGTIVDSEGRVLYRNGELTRLGKDQLKRRYKRTLPQTGKKDNESIGLIGALLAGLGIFGLADRKKRKKKN